MTKKRINIKSKLSKNKKLFFIFILIILFIFLMFIPLGSMSAAYRNAGAIAGIILFYIIKLTRDKDTSDYLSFIDIYSNKIVLVYKNKDKIIKEHKILNKNIQSIEVIIEVNDNPAIGDYSGVRFSSTTVNITTDNEPPIIFTEQNDVTKFSGGPFDLAIKFIKYRKNLPKFSYRFEGESELANKEIEHALKTGHGYNFIQRFYNAGPTGKFCAFLFLFSMLLSINMIFLIINTSNMEKRMKIDNEISQYYQIAADYYKKGQYEQGILEAEKGINILNEYINQGKLGKNEWYIFYLYRIIGDCERESKNYNKAIEAYDYIVANDENIDLNIYYKRGKCKYYIGHKEQALNDFYQYKQLVEKYIEEQLNKKSTNKVETPFYSYKDIEKAEHWIELCNQ